MMKRLRNVRKGILLALLVTLAGTVQGCGMDPVAHENDPPPPPPNCVWIGTQIHCT